MIVRPESHRTGLHPRRALDRPDFGRSGGRCDQDRSPEGDDTRIWRPLFIERGGDKAAAYFHCANKGKTSFAIDMKDPEDLAWLKSMIAGADILIENFKVRGSDKVWSRFGQIARRALRPGLFLSYRLWTRRALCLPLGL